MGEVTINLLSNDWEKEAQRAERLRKFAPWYYKKFDHILQTQGIEAVFDFIESVPLYQRIYLKLIHLLERLIWK